MDLSNYLDFSNLLLKRNEFKRVFFYRICGTGMGAAACLLQEKGYEVEGGDTNFYPPMSDYLKETGIPLHQLEKVDRKKLQSFDLIVVGNVVPREGEAAKLIESLGVPFCSFPAMLGAFILNDCNVVGVAGTHGKTTTTYFLSQLFEKLGENPGYFIGGVIEGKRSAQLGDGRYFFIESDEYDSAYFEKISKFRSYALNHLILTSLEFDHADIFENVESIKNEFRPVIKDLQGSLFANQDYNAIQELHDEFNGKKWFFYSEKSQEGPTILSENDKGTTFSLQFQEKEHSFQTNVIGVHNILNLSSTVLFALHEGYEYEAIALAIKELKFVKRRQELRGYYKEAPVIDDFAHHPRSVTCTIQAIRAKYPTKKICVVLEPNSATARSNIFQKEFTEALLEADKVILARAERATTVRSQENLHYDEMAEELNAKGVSTRTASSLEKLRQDIDAYWSSDALFLILSNGTCLGLWKSDFVKELKK